MLRLDCWNYGQYNSNNYGSCRAIEVSDGEHYLVLYYSYSTIIAFSESGTGRRVSENVWSVTTGKHLNWIDGGEKSTRLKHGDFERELKMMLTRYKLQYLASEMRLANEEELSRWQS